MKKLFIVLFLTSLTCSISSAKSKLVKSGTWRMELYLNESHTLPFNFQIDKKSLKIVINNADEKIELTDVHFIDGKISVKFPIFNSEFIGDIHSKKLIKGYWHNYSKGPDYKIPFTSTFGVTKRFNKTQNSDDLYNGKWEVTFDYKGDDPEKSIGLFEKKNGVMHGTFLTETGDYRFLEGVSTSSTLQLSCFDGSHAFLFEADLKQDTLWGTFLSGSHYQTEWFAVKNKNFELRDPEKLTYIANDNPLEFTFRDINDKDYIYPNTETKNKVVVIQILGTWCPNCMDETNYLTSIYSQYSDQLEIIAVGFETGETHEDKIFGLQKYQTYMKVDYPLLLGGEACKPCAEEAFPMLNGIMSFPTLIIIDKTGQIRKIHTGFSGPSTGQYYTDFVTHTTQFIEALIKE